MDIITAISSKSLTKDTNFSNCILIVDSYSKLPRLYGMLSITTDEVMEKPDMFQDIFGKVDEFGWWDLYRIQTYGGTQFTSKEFQRFLSVHGLRLTLVATDHQ